MDVVEELLVEWRRAEAAIAGVAPGSKAHLAAQRAVDEARDAYQVAVAERLRLAQELAESGA